MIPLVDDPTATDQATGPGRIPSVPVDRVRVVVQVVLAIYLSPVILLVCLIGAISILASGVSRKVKKVVDRLGRADRSWAGRRGEEKNGPRLIYRRERSRSTR